MSDTAPILMHFPLARRYAMSAVGYAIRRKGWLRLPTDAAVTPLPAKVAWLSYRGGLWYKKTWSSSTVNVETVVHAADFTDDDMLAQDWTLLAPSCTAAETVCDCGSGLMLGIAPYPGTIIGTVAVYDIGKPNALIGLTDCTPQPLDWRTYPDIAACNCAAPTTSPVTPTIDPPKEPEKPAGSTAGGGKGGTGGSGGSGSGGPSGGGGSSTNSGGGGGSGGSSATPPHTPSHGMDDAGTGQILVVQQNNPGPPCYTAGSPTTAETFVVSFKFETTGTYTAKTWFYDLYVKNQLVRNGTIKGGDTIDWTGRLIGTPGIPCGTAQFIVWLPNSDIEFSRSVDFVLHPWCSV